MKAKGFDLSERFKEPTNKNINKEKQEIKKSKNIEKSKKEYK
jgi:hypothetical protein